MYGLKKYAGDVTNIEIWWIPGLKIKDNNRISKMKVTGFSCGT
jgi:hypothetical protein